MKNEEVLVTEEPLVSVIIPSYNRENVLGRSIDSVLRQSYANIECIVVDDNSDDNTESIVKQYDDKRVRYVKLTQQSGACAARNIGLKKAKGEYVAFQDSDDVWRKDKLKDQINIIKETGSDLNFCNILVHDGNNNVKKLILDNERMSLIRRKGISKALLEGNFISTQSIVGKKACFDKIEFDERLPRLQDYDLVLRLSRLFRWSISRNIGVDSYVQSDSISRNYEKLKRATKMMMSKNYGFSRADSCRLNATLLKTLGDVNYCVNMGLAKKYYQKALMYRFGNKKNTRIAYWAYNFIVNVYIALRRIKNRINNIVKRK